MVNKKKLFWQSYLNLEKELLNLSNYVFITDVPDDNQLNVYSSHIADLLVKTCVEIEAIAKEINRNLGGPEKKR